MGMFKIHYKNKHYNKNTLHYNNKRRYRYSRKRSTVIEADNERHKVSDMLESVRDDYFRTIFFNNGTVIHTSQFFYTKFILVS